MKKISVLLLALTCCFAQAQITGPSNVTVQGTPPVVLKNNGLATQYLDASGNYSVPAGSSSGTVSSVSVVTANGLAGTVANATTTPAITLTTGITGILSGNGTAISAASTTGSGSVVLSTSPTLVTPILGTPTSGVATNLTGTASGLTAGTVTTNANLTGPITSVGNATSVAAQTGTGSTFVMQTSPTLTTPTIGVATATSINKVGLTAPATSATLTLADGSTLATSGANSVTLTSTGTTNVTLPTSGTLATTTRATDAFGALTDITTNNVSTSAHGFTPKLPNDATKYLDGTGAYTVPAGTTPVLRNYISGFGLTYNSTTVLSIAAGFAADSANAVNITGTSFTKSTAGAWVAGSGNNGMGNGLTVANNTWYAVCAAIISGSYDAFFDTSATCTNTPASTTATRRIGFVKTNGSAQIIQFYQYGPSFRWFTQVVDFNGAPPSSATLTTLTVPVGVVVKPVISILYNDTASGDTYSVWSPGAGNTKKNEIIAQSIVSSVNTGSSGSSVLTNTSAQVYHATNGATVPNVILYTLGWEDATVAPY